MGAENVKLFLREPLVRESITSTSYLKEIFWFNFFVGSGFQILNTREYACGLQLGSALILNQNPFFEMPCIHQETAAVISQQ